MKYHDKYIKDKTFKLGDWTLLYDSRYKDNLRKLQKRWLGPYEVIGTFPNGTVQLATIDHVKFKLLVNGHRLRLYHKSISKEEFLQQFITLEVAEIPAAKVGGLIVPPSS